MADSNHRFYSDKDLQNIAEDIDKVVTIPVNMVIEAEHRVFDLSEVEKILRESQKIVVQNCGCRLEYGNCDSPLDVCLLFDKEADNAISDSKYNPREITVEEALRVLRRSHEAGLVHMAYVMKGETKPGLLCSCCSCCCHTLGGLLKYGIHAKVLTSKLIASDLHENCSNCGECIKRCVFGARTMIEDELVFDASKCFGCGLCVSVCPSNVIGMVVRRNE